MFGHLYIISQQSHKSAPTGIRGICLKPIIGDAGINAPPTQWPVVIVKNHHCAHLGC